MSRLLLVVTFLLLGACGGGGGSGSSVASKPASSASVSPASMSSASSSENVSTAASVSSSSSQTSEAISSAASSMTSGLDSSSVASSSLSSSQSSEFVVSSAAQSSGVTSSISSSAGSSAAEVLTGVFLDSEVENLDYKTSRKSGVTDENGKYSYDIEGEAVVFSIGNLTFPAVPATGVVTPFELFQGTKFQNFAFYNLVRLLMTLDEDGNPDNGITISDEAKKIASAAINFQVDFERFENNADVLNLIANAGQIAPVAKLVSIESAKEHFGKYMKDKFILDLRDYTATQVIDNNSCGNSQKGVLNFTFTQGGIQVTGRDRWVNCILQPDDGAVGTVAVADILPEDFFYCKEYPKCMLADFSRVETGTDRDGRIYDFYIALKSDLTLEVVKDLYSGDDFESVVTFTKNTK